EEPAPYLRAPRGERQPKPDRRPSGAVEMGVREDHAASDQQPRLVAETMLPLLVASAIVVVDLGRRGLLIVVGRERGEDTGADGMTARGIGDKRRLLLHLHASEIMARGLAGETNRQPLDRNMAIAVIMVAGEILGAEFPIARHLPFDDAADHLVAIILAIRPLQQGAQIELHVGTEIILEGRRGLVETRPDRAVELRHPRADEAPFLALELALIALLEFRHAGQRAVEPIGP